MPVEQVASAVLHAGPCIFHWRRLAAVVEDRLADDLDLNAALDALDHAHQHVVGVVVGRRPRVVEPRRRGRRCQGPIVSPSRTTSQPDGVSQVVSSTIVPGT